MADASGFARSGKLPKRSVMNSSSAYERVITSDGSVTYYSEEFQQAFHNLSGARQEALEKYVFPTRLLSLAAQRDELHLLDVCFGLGYNSGVALEHIWQVNPNCRVILHALERSPDVPRQALEQGLWGDWSFANLWRSWLERGWVQGDRLCAHLHWGDARRTIENVPRGWADAVFFDPFTPPSCPQLWTVELFQQVARCLHPSGRLATYSCAVAVRAGMLAAGLYIGSTPPVGRPGPGTLAALTPDNLPELSQREREHLQTRAAIPYRDPSLAASAEEILTNRQLEQQLSHLEATSAWKKRWKPQRSHSA